MMVSTVTVLASIMLYDVDQSPQGSQDDQMQRSGHRSSLHCSTLSVTSSWSQGRPPHLATMLTSLLARLCPPPQGTSQEPQLHGVHVQSIGQQPR